MSAPALHPTARTRPVLLDRLERQRGGHGWAALFLAGMAVYLRLDSSQVTYSAALVCVLLGGVFLPAAQTIGAQDQPVWDAALPVDPARYALVRLGCGVAGAAFLLAVVVGLYAALFGDPGHPGWYPLTLFATGLTFYLGVSAVLLAIGQATAGIYVVVLLILCSVTLPVPVLLLDPVVIERMTGPEVLARAALPLGLAAAAAYAAARFQARAPAPAGPAARGSLVPHRDAARALPDRPAPIPVLLAPIPVLLAPIPVLLAPIPDRPAPSPVRRGPARPPSALTVIRRHFALLRRYTVLPATTVVMFAVFLGITALAGGEEGEVGTVLYFAESTGLHEVCTWLALSWTVLVWLGEHGPRRRWNDTLPVGTAKRRILHATAGAAWLLLFLTVVAAAALGGAAAAGTLDSPADVPAWLWLGLPCRTLTLYLAATFVFFGMHVVWVAFWKALAVVVPNVISWVLPEHSPFMLGLVVTLLVGAVTWAGLFAVLELFFILGINLLRSQALVVAGDAGSDTASILWLALFAAAAAVALVLSDWIRHRDRLPTVREVRGFLHGWAGTRPGPLLRGHAGR